MPPTRIQLPDGSIGEFPEGMSESQIESVLANQFPATTAKNSIQNVPGAIPGMAEPNARPAPPTLSRYEPTVKQSLMANPQARGDIPSGNLEFQGLVQGGKRIAHELGQAWQGVKEGNPWAVAAHGVQAIPFVGAGLQEGSDALKPGQSLLQQMGSSVKPALSTAIEVAPLAATGMDVVAPGRTPMTAGRLPGAGMVRELTSPTRGYNSPLIPKNEAIARKAADVLQISPTAREGAVSTMVKNLPDVKATLGEAGVGTPKPIEFAKGAMRSGKATTDFYQKNIVEPNWDAPAGGSTVGDLYGRVTKINAELIRIPIEDRTGADDQRGI